MSGPEIQWCTLCGKRFTEEEVQGVDRCPACGSQGVPCGTDQDLTVQINWHELRILGIWASNWIDKSPTADVQTRQLVRAILGRLERQRPDLTPLTLSGEIAQLRREFGNVETNVPGATPYPVNGPGAVREECESS